MAEDGEAVANVPGTDLPGSGSLLLKREGLVRKLLGRRLIGVYRWLASGVEVGGLLLVPLDGGIGIGPHAEEVDLAPDLRASLGVAVRGQGERGVGIVRLGARSSSSHRAADLRAHDLRESRERADGCRQGCRLWREA